MGTAVPKEGEMNPWDRAEIRERVKPWVLDGYLTEYQREAWSWSATRDGSFLWWACGAGKTLGALLWLVSHSRRTRKVVVTKAATKRQWKAQGAQYTDMQMLVLDGQGGMDIPQETECIVISWETLMHWYPYILTWKGMRPLVIVWDEIHKGKAWKRKEKILDEDGDIQWVWLENRAAYAAKLSRIASARLGLTATPIRDRRRDLWAQLDLIQPEQHGTNWNWVHRFCAAKQGEYGGIDTTGESNCAQLKHILSRIVHAVSYAEMARSLPPKRRQLVYLSPSEQTKPSAFRDTLKRAAKMGKQHLFEANLSVAASTKRKWIADSVMSCVEAGQKVAVFTGRRKDCDALAKLIKTRVKKLGAPVWHGHGGDSVKYRMEQVAQYAAAQGAGVFVGTTDAFGEAIDGLQHTDAVYFAMLPWTPGQVTQAEGRFSRHGSDRPVLLTYVVSEGTVDEHVADVLLEKLEGVSGVTGDEDATALAGTLAGDGHEDEIMDSILDLAALAGSL
jgi:hypothetical protein|tara:strand:- start:13449 stop:14960 length:1512 start_codon:yes stop_codon:yes gene_type:complete